jgi:copper(I)-binding protein
MKKIILVILITTGGWLAACSEHRNQDTSQSDKVHDEQSAPKEAAISSQIQDGILVQNAWVRPTIGEQDATSAYLTITSPKDLTLIGVSSPIAKIAELHEMKMEGDIMRMRMAERIEIKSSEALELKPGGFHAMLMALTTPIVAGQEIELSLHFEQLDGSKIEMPLKVFARQNPKDSVHHSHEDSDEHRH